MNEMTYREALHVLESEEGRQEAGHECRAEAGMSAVSMGFSGYDGMAEWDAANPGPGADYFERLAEARAVVEAFPVKVTWHSPFTQRYVALAVAPDGSRPAPSEDDIPF